MIAINHRIGIKAPIAKVYAALATTQGVAGWWTAQTSGSSEVGKSIEVHFLSKEGKEIGSMGIDVMVLDPNKRVEWKFTSGPPEWIETDVVFKLVQEGDYTIVLFSHKNWREAVEFTSHCSMKWAIFMLSLKELLETGKGKPSPNDFKIDNWN